GGVRGEGPVPVLDRVLDERPRPVDAGVADEPVEPAEVLNGLGHGPAGPVRCAHVSANGERVRAELTELLDQGVERRDVDGRYPGDAPGGSRVACKPHTRGVADAARRSRHEDTHGISLSSEGRAAPTV